MAFISALPLSILHSRSSISPIRSRSLNVRSNFNRLQVVSSAALEKDNTEQMQRLPFLSTPRGAALAILMHLAVGALFMCFVEGWPLLDALYFVVVIATTVGYGDMSPSRKIGKLFVAAYAIVSVALIAGLLQGLVDRVAQAHGGMAERAARTLMRREGQGGEEVVEDGDIVQAAKIGVLKARLRLRATMMMFVGACVSGMFLYGYFLKMNIIDVLYFLCVSMTTVGLGDIHPISKMGKGFAAVWLILTSLGFAGILSQYAELKVKVKEMEMVERLLKNDLNEKMFAEIDGDGSNTLSEAEFLGYMMCKLGKASPDDIRGVLGRFQELDKDGSGIITKSEVIAGNKKSD